MRISLQIIFVFGCLLGTFDEAAGQKNNMGIVLVRYKLSQKTSREKFEAFMETIKKNPFAMANVPGVSDDAADRFLKDNADLIAKQKLASQQKQSVIINNPIELGN